MAVDFTFSFGNYTYGSRLSSLEHSLIVDAMIGDAPGAYGRSSGGLKYQERRINMSGTVHGSSHDDLRSKKDEFRRYHLGSGINKLTVQGDRWVWACPTGTIPDGVTNFLYWQWELEMVAADPFFYGGSVNTVSLVSGSPSVTVDSGNTTREYPESTFEVDGTAPPAPFLSFTVSSIDDTDPAAYIRVDNTSEWSDGNEFFLFYPQATGQHAAYFGPNPTSDLATNLSRGNKVWSSSAGTSVNKWRRGRPLTMLPGECSFKLTAYNCQVSAAALNWINRYL